MYCDGGTNGKDDISATVVVVYVPQDRRKTSRLGVGEGKGAKHGGEGREMLRYPWTYTETRGGGILSTVSSRDSDFNGAVYYLKGRRGIRYLKLVFRWCRTVNCTVQGDSRILVRSSVSLPAFSSLDAILVSSLFLSFIQLKNSSLPISRMNGSSYSIPF